jgi:hypothetical protein
MEMVLEKRNNTALKKFFLVLLLIKSSLVMPAEDFQHSFLAYCATGVYIGFHWLKYRCDFDIIEQLRKPEGRALFLEALEKFTHDVYDNGSDDSD